MNIEDHQRKAAENERLRAELAESERVGGKLMEEREQLGHEIERLRQSRLPDEVVDIKVVIELRAENERLRKDVIHWREARRSCIQAGDMMKAEIERLRADVAEWRRQAESTKRNSDYWYEKYNNMLRANERGWLAANGPGGWIDDLRQEIERLRKSLDDHLDSEAAETRRADRERARARAAEAEIERLRMITAPGSCECSPEDACRYARERDEARADIERLRHEMAEMAVANVAATKTAIGSYQDEIERLRSLLREALRIDDGDFSVSVDDWIKRVREALEEQC